MKKTIALVITGIAVSLFVSSQACAFAEDDMMEGMSLAAESSQKSEKSYKYDNIMASASESMTEFVFFPEQNAVAKKYSGDSTCPTAHHLMSEGICLNHFAQELASR